MVQQSAADAPVIIESAPGANAAESIRILHVHSGNLYGGVETMLLTQVQQRNLCPAMETSFALCFSGQLSEKLLANGAPVHWLGEVRIRRPLSVRKARQKLRELLRLQDFGIAVTHSSWAQVIFGPVVRAANVPLVFYLHGPANGRHWLDRWARRTPPDVAICNSQFTASTLPSIYPQLKAEVVYCPVASLPESDAQTNAKTTRAEFATAEDATVIVQVSRMESWKGHELHLEALARLQDLEGWVCWFVGSAQRTGELRYVEELKRSAKRLGLDGRVRFLGQRSDVQTILAAADIFCQPNTGPEPFGIVFVEALHAQLPVVTTAMGGAREIVDDSCGMLVKPGDVGALAAALRRLIEDRTLRVGLGSAGPQRAHELCDPAARLNQFQEALSAIIPVRST